MTVGDLIDYLEQFDHNLRVVLSSDEIEVPCEFIALDSLDYKVTVGE